MEKETSTNLCKSRKKRFADYSAKPRWIRHILVSFSFSLSLSVLLIMYTYLFPDVCLPFFRVVRHRIVLR